MSKGFGGVPGELFGDSGNGKMKGNRTGNIRETPKPLDPLPSWEPTSPLPAATFESMIFFLPWWDMLVPWSANKKQQGA